MDTSGCSVKWGVARFLKSSESGGKGHAEAARVGAWRTQGRVLPDDTSSIQNNSSNNNVLTVLYVTSVLVPYLPPRLVFLG